MECYIGWGAILGYWDFPFLGELVEGLCALGELGAAAAFAFVDEPSLHAELW